MKISRSVIPRLSVYYRALVSYDQEAVISSDKLSELTGYTAAQIRKDLACFGQFGTPGKGYVIGGLKKKILEILGIDKRWTVALVGTGNLGTALLSYKGFKRQGFDIIAAFDNDPKKIGTRISGVPVQHISKLKKTINAQNIQMAIVTTPADSAQETINSLVKSGIKSILNFSPIRPHVPQYVELINIDLSIELEKLSHFTGKKTR
ncbi:MAG: redox-sensing transcriptional repressor Rex [Candidatus Omnitrophica bacterium]|nr:redox-sensing transcriptional repressor Rex [Candidatus Omnitrophota bacterium]